MNRPAPIKTMIQYQGTSPSAPHQLSPLPKAIGANNSASAAGLKMCSRFVARMRLLSTAKPLVHAITSHDSSTDRMLKTNNPLSSALVGMRSRRDSMDIHTPSMRHAGTMAAARFGSSAAPPDCGTVIASRIAKIASICAFGVRSCSTSCSPAFAFALPPSPVRRRPRSSSCVQA